MKMGDLHSKMYVSTLRTLRKLHIIGFDVSTTDRLRRLASVSTAAAIGSIIDPVVYNKIYNRHIVGYITAGPRTHVRLAMSVIAASSFGDMVELASLLAKDLHLDFFGSPEAGRSILSLLATSPTDNGKLATEMLQNMDANPNFYTALTDAFFNREESISPSVRPNVDEVAKRTDARTQYELDRILADIYTRYEEDGIANLMEFKRVQDLLRRHPELEERINFEIDRAQKQVLAREQYFNENPGAREQYQKVKKIDYDTEVDEQPKKDVKKKKEVQDPYRVKHQDLSKPDPTPAEIGLVYGTDATTKNKNMRKLLDNYDAIINKKLGIYLPPSWEMLKFGGPILIGNKRVLVNGTSGRPSDKVPLVGGMLLHNRGTGETGIVCGYNPQKNAAGVIPTTTSQSREGLTAEWSLDSPDVRQSMTSMKPSVE